MVAKGGWGEGEEWTGSLGLVDANLLHLEWINNRVLMYSTGNYIQYRVINHMEKNIKKKNVSMCITESLCCTAEIDTAL